MMNQLKSSMLVATFSILTAALILLLPSSVSASEEKQGYIAPSTSFISGGNIYGVTGKIMLGGDFAMRPFIQFTNRDSGSLTVYGASITGNINIPNSPLVPYAGMGIQGGTATGTGSVSQGIYGEFGADYNFTENLAFNLNYKTPNFGGTSIALGYRF